MRIEFTFPSVSQLDAKHQGYVEIKLRISRIERIKTQDMDTRYGHRTHFQGRWQALPKPYPSPTQALPKLMSMARVWLQYGYSMGRVWLEHLTQGLSPCVVESLTVRRVRTLSPTCSDCQSDAFGLRSLRYAVCLLLMMVVGVNTVWGQTTLPKPTISKSGNTVTITSSNSEAGYYYTIGPNEPLTSEPTISAPSVKYTGPFTVSNDVMCIKAIAVHQSTRSEVTAYNILRFTDSAINAGTATDVTVAPLVYSCDLAKPTGMTPYIVSRITTLDHNAVLRELEYIPEGVPVLLLDNTGTNTGKKDNIILNPIDLETLNNDETTTNDITPISASDKAANQLRVSDGAVTVADAQVYMYYNGEFVLTFGGTLKAGRYYMYNPIYNSTSTTASTGAPTLQLMIEGTTGVDDVRCKKEDVRGDVWHTLDGRRLSGRATAKGIYINNGQKIVIK